MRTNLVLETGTRLEFWAQGPGYLRISVGGEVVFQVPQFGASPGFFRYIHSEACTIALEWDRPEAILWAYSYQPQSVASTGITVWDFQTDDVARRTGSDITAWMRADPERPVMHFSPIRQWMNDPNGLCKVGDIWHLFYQFHPAGTDWGPMHWGHASSRNLFTWTHLPVFLHPDQNLWQLGATGGAFSGNAFRDRDGALSFFYTERLPAYDLFKGYREVQKHARPDRNLITPEGIISVVEDRPAGVAQDFRDPKVWWDEATEAYRMVLGASLDGDPAVLLYGSADLSAWTYLGPIYRAPGRFRAEGARAVECPDFFPLGDKWVLVMGFVGHTDPASGRHNLLYATVGDFRQDRFFPDRSDLQLLDFGTDYYAMQSFSADGRQIAFAWLFNWEDRKPAGSPYSGEMSLPRQVSLTGDGRLAMTPVAEIDEVWPATAIPATSPGNYSVPDQSLEIVLDGPLDGTRIVATEGGQPAFEITISHGRISVRLAQDDGTIGYDAFVGAGTDLRVFHDRGIVEIFACAGTVCGTRRGYVRISPDSLSVQSMAKVSVWRRISDVGP